jgi:hypothetical protein
MKIQFFVFVYLAIRSLRMSLPFSTEQRLIQIFYIQKNLQASGFQLKQQKTGC